MMRQQGHILYGHKEGTEPPSGACRLRQSRGPGHPKTRHSEMIQISPWIVTSRELREEGGPRTSQELRAMNQNASKISRRHQKLTKPGHSRKSSEVPRAWQDAVIWGAQLPLPLGRRTISAQDQGGLAILIQLREGCPSPSGRTNTPNRLPLPHWVFQLFGVGLRIRSGHTNCAPTLSTNRACWIL